MARIEKLEIMSWNTVGKYTIFRCWNVGIVEKGNKTKQKTRKEKKTRKRGGRNRKTQTLRMMVSSTESQFCPLSGDTVCFGVCTMCVEKSTIQQHSILFVLICIGCPLSWWAISVNTSPSPVPRPARLSYKSNKIPTQHIFWWHYVWLLHEWSHRGKVIS